MKPEELRRLADEADVHGKAALEAGAPREAARHFHRAENFRAAADEMERLAQKSLPDVHESRSVDKVEFSAEHKVEMSRAHVDPKHRLAAAAHRVGLTITGLAERVGVSKSLLSKAFKGQRTIPTAVAEKVRDITGLPVSAWPRLGS